MYKDFDFSQLNHDLLKTSILSDTNNDLIPCGLEIEAEITSINTQIRGMDSKTIPFDKWDFILAFVFGVLEVAGDFLISDHNQKNSLTHQMSDKNSKLGQAFASIHQKLEHSRHPLDYQGYKFGGGNHRSRTFCHDVLMFPLALCMLSRGEFIDGYYEDNVYQFVKTSLNQHGKEYVGLSAPESLIAYFIHMIADFFSAKSLPIPGFSALTHFPNREIRVFASKLYNDGLNLRNLVMQGVPVASVELLTWVYTALRYKDSEYHKEQINRKKERLLLISHGLATAINIGKVVITKEVTSLNFPVIIRVIQLVLRECVEYVTNNQKTTEKLYLSLLKNELESMKTLILLENCIYTTKDFNVFLATIKKNLDDKTANRINTLSSAQTDMRALLRELKDTNGENT